MQIRTFLKKLMVFGNQNLYREKILQYENYNVDYGMGNIRSVAQALLKVAPDARVVIANTPAQIRAADRIILPGQGAMPDCMAQLASSGLLEEVLCASKNKPLLGVCVGEQMLFENSAEAHAPHLVTPCLGLFPGSVVRFNLHQQELPNGQYLKVPHMGWNTVESLGETPLLAGVEGQHFYFVHGYAVKSSECSTATTEYGGRFVSVASRDNFFATQFHPEKSQHAGLQLLKNFIHWDGNS